MKIIQDELHPAIKYVNLFPLSHEEQVLLIDTFHECYFDTAVEVQDFAVEFQRVVSHILSHYVPVQLEQLVDFQPIILGRFTNIMHFSAYEKAIKGEN